MTQSLFPASVSSSVTLGATLPPHHTMVTGSYWRPRARAATHQWRHLLPRPPSPEGPCLWFAKVKVTLNLMRSKHKVKKKKTPVTKFSHPQPLQAKLKRKRKIWSSPGRKTALSTDPGKVPDSWLPSDKGLFPPPPSFYFYNLERNRKGYTCLNVCQLSGSACVLEADGVVSLSQKTVLTWGKDLTGQVGGHLPSRLQLHREPCIWYSDPKLQKDSQALSLISEREGGSRAQVWDQSVSRDLTGTEGWPRLLGPVITAPLWNAHHLNEIVCANRW